MVGYRRFGGATNNLILLCWWFFCITLCRAWRYNEGCRGRLLAHVDFRLSMRNWRLLDFAGSSEPLLLQSLCYISWRILLKEWIGLFNVLIFIINNKFHLLIFLCNSLSLSNDLFFFFFDIFFNNLSILSVFELKCVIIITTFESVTSIKPIVY